MAVNHILSEPQIMRPSLVEECNNLLISDLASKGPIRMLAYSASNSVQSSPVYAFSNSVNDTLIGEVIVGSVSVNGPTITFSSIPDILNSSGFGLDADIYEIRSTVGDQLYFRIKGNGRRINNNEVLRTVSLTINANDDPAPAQTDLYPDSSPYPVQFRLELPLWANSNAYSEMRGASIELYLGDGLGYGDTSIEFPQTKTTFNIGAVTDLVGESNKTNSDFCMIDGEFTNNNLTFNYSIMPTVPFFKTDVTNPITGTGYYEYKFVFSTARKLFYNPNGDLSSLPSWVNASPTVFRKKNGENTFTEIPVLLNTSSTSGSYITSNLYGESGTYRIRTWCWGVLL